MFAGSGGFGGSTGGFGGSTGGFGGSTGGGFNQSQNSPGGSKRPGADASKKPSNLMPVTVAMMLQADHNKADDLFNYKGVDIHMVTFVGVIRDIIEASTSVTYKIDDYTGPNLSVRKFIQEGEDDLSSMPRSHSYVRVYGHLRSMNDQRNVIAFAVRPLETHDELTVHLLDVVRSQLKHRKGFTSNGGGMVGASAGSFSNGNGNNGSVDPAVQGLTQSQLQVYTALKGSSSDIGMSIMEIQKTNNGSLDIGGIKKAIEFLSNEGHIYSTVDDEHYKLTDYC